MQKTEHPRRKTLAGRASRPAAPPPAPQEIIPQKPPSLDVGQIPDLLDAWLLDGRGRQHSVSTLATRKLIVEKFLWFLKRRGFPSAGAFEMRQFLVYCREGHAEPGGRWGQPRLTEPMRPRSVNDYFRHIRTFYAWLVTEEALTVSPLERLSAPEWTADEIVPFSDAQITALKAATAKGDHRRRDLAIVLLLLDTGVRAAELCSLRVRDVDRLRKCATVLGKGNKRRQVYFGATTARALHAYLSEQPRRPEDALFASDRGVKAGQALTRSGLFQLIERLGVKGSVITPGAKGGVRCSPHTFRHTFAVNFLRAGGQEMVLMRLLGHTRLDMTSRYVRFVQADVEHSYQQHSPVERMGK